MARRICDRAEAVIVLSQTGRKMLIDDYGVDPDKLHVIHHGVPDAPFRSTTEAKAHFGLQGRAASSRPLA